MRELQKTNNYSRNAVKSNKSKFDEINLISNKNKNDNYIKYLQSKENERLQNNNRHKIF